MSEPIGIRLPKDILKKIERLGKSRMVDRSTVIRELIIRGYNEVLRQMACEEYTSGKLTFSEAAHLAGMTLWEFESHLVNQGFKSSYSVEDLERELESLK